MRSSRPAESRVGQNEPLLEIRDVTVYRGGTRVFDHFDLSIAQGQNTVILGPNGAGKTTLLQLIARELYPMHRRGSSVRILGRERWDVFELRSRLGTISPDLQLRYQRHLSALDVVLSGYFSSVGLYRHHQVSESQRDRARELLEALGAGGSVEAEFTTLSTGEQRRCLLARALVHDPPALLFDEPTASLDLRAAFDLVGQLRSLMRQGRTLVLVTHDLRDISPEIHRVVLLRGGRVLADGPPSETLTSEGLSQLYGCSLRVGKTDGWYRAVPGD